MANLQFKGSDFKVKYPPTPDQPLGATLPIPVPDGFTPQAFQDQINAAAHYGQDWPTRLPFLAANSIWGGDGDFQRPNGAWPATADPHGTTNGQPNYVGSGKSLANVTFGAAAAAAGVSLDDAKKGAGFLNQFSSDPDKSGTYDLNSRREAEIEAGYKGYGQQYSADSSTPLPKIQSMAGDDAANLPGVAAGGVKAVASKVAQGAEDAANWVGNTLDSGWSALKTEFNGLTTPSGPSSTPPDPAQAPSPTISKGSSSAAPDGGDASTSVAGADDGGSSGVDNAALTGAGSGGLDAGSDTSNSTAADSNATANALATTASLSPDGTATSSATAGATDGPSSLASASPYDPATLTDQDVAELTPDFASWSSMMNGGTGAGLQDA